MEEHSSDGGQLELLAKIHNQLVGLKKILVEIELAKPGTTEVLKTQLRELIDADQPIDPARAGGIGQRERHVITPTDTEIEPGEGRNEGHKQ